LGAQENHRNVSGLVLRVFVDLDKIVINNQARVNGGSNMSTLGKDFIKKSKKVYNKQWRGVKTQEVKLI